MGKDITNDFAYSDSRGRLFDDCQRAFWYQYYCSWKGWEKDAPEQSRAAYILKHAQTWRMWVGDIVHQVAAGVLNDARRRPGWFAKVGKDQVREKMMNKAQDMVDQGLKDSQSKAYMEDPKRRTQLLEMTFGWRLDENEVRSKVADHIAALAGDDIRWAKRRNLFFSALMNHQDIVGVEQKSSFDFDGVKIWLVTDLVVNGRGPGSTVIYDWKSGPVKERDKKQLVLYNAAAKRFGWDTVLGVLVYTAEVPVRSIMVAPRPGDGVGDLRASVSVFKKKVSANLVDGDTIRNEAVEDRFSVTPRKEGCRFCKFQMLCAKDGKRP